MSDISARKLGILLVLIILIACNGSASTATPQLSNIPLPTSGPLPPTFTPPATAVPQPSATPRPPSTPVVTATSIDFDKTAVELSYAIPAIGLSRRLRGNISGQITAVDETTGRTEEFSNQANVLIELQEVLPDLVLEAAPDGCDTCVQISYELPLSDESAAGWLQDVTILASLDNFMTAVLDPHFPPQTRLALRRSISPYAPAHTLALTEDGQLWRWLATDPQIPEPVDSTEVPDLLLLLNSLPLAELEEEYVVTCEGAPPVENLFIGSDTPTIRIECPEFTLPSTLLQLYLSLSDLLEPTTADVSIPRPQAAIPLTALLDYRRADESRLTLYHDGRFTAISASTTATGTVSISQIDELTTNLLSSGQLQVGLTTFNPTATPALTGTTEAETTAVSQLLVRGPQGVYDGQWAGIPDLVGLNDLLDSLLVPQDGPLAATETAVVPEPTKTPTPNP